MIKIRERRTGSKTRWQIDFSAPLGGQGPERRWRFNAPSFITSRSAAERWARDALARVLRGEPPAPTRPAREQRAAEAVVREQAERTAEREAATFAAWCEQSVEVDGDAFRALVRDAKDALDRLYRELS